MHLIIHFRYSEYFFMRIGELLQSTRRLSALLCYNQIKMSPETQALKVKYRSTTTGTLPRIRLLR